MHGQRNGAQARSRKHHHRITLVEPAGSSEKFRLANEMLRLELRATRNYTLLMRNWTGTHRNRDFFEDVISATNP